MNDEQHANLTYEQKEKRLDEILERLDKSETPMDKLAEEAKEAGELIRSMQATLKSAQTKVSEVLKNLDDESNGNPE